MSSTNTNHAANDSIPLGMHLRAATVAHNPGQRSPAFGNTRTPLVQPTLEQMRARAAMAAAPPQLVHQMVVFLPAVQTSPEPPTPPRRFESATKDDPILLSPVKPRMRTLYLEPMVDLTAE